MRILAARNNAGLAAACRPDLTLPVRKLCPDPEAAVQAPTPIRLNVAHVPATTLGATIHPTRRPRLDVCLEALPIGTTLTASKHS